MSTMPAAYPYIEVSIDTSGLTPIAQRSPGVIAVVGHTPAGAAGGTAAVDTPFWVATLDQAAGLFAQTVAGSVVPTPLYSSLEIAFQQNPAASKVYGVRAAPGEYAAALAALEGADDVDFVSLANEVSVGTASGGGNAATGLMALKEHVENMSSQGLKRIGVAMVDPAHAKSNTYATDVNTTMTPLQSSDSRMVVVAARGATVDVATAAMAAIAGYDPQVSMVLKPVGGVEIPAGQAFSPAEIMQLSQANINPLIAPALIVGGAIRFGDGRTYTTDADLLYIDIVRVLDDIDFRLKAGLIGMIGDARITKAGLRLISTRIDGILGPLVNAAEIDDYDFVIPVLDILSTPESTWTPTDAALVQTARANRAVDVAVSITYGPATHQLLVKLTPKF